VSAYVAYQTTSMETRLNADIAEQKNAVQVEIAGNQGATERAIEALKADTQTSISDKQSETQKLVVKMQGDISQAIEDLKAETQKSISEKQSETRKLVVKMQGNTSQAIEDLKAETQTSIAEKQNATRELVVKMQNDTSQAIAKLNDDTMAAIASSEHAIERAKLFAEAFKGLSTAADDVQRSLMLLALWQIADTKEHRRVIVATALTLKSPAAIDTLIQLGSKIEPHLQAALRAGPEISAAAQQVLDQISTADAAQVNLGDILENDDPSPFDENVKALARRVSDDAEAREAVLSAVKNTPSHAPILNFVLYMAGEGPALDRLLATADDPERFEYVIKVLDRGGVWEIRPEDYLKVGRKVILWWQESRGDEYDLSSVAGVLEHLLGRADFSPAERAQVEALAARVVASPEAYEWSRFYAFEILANHFPVTAVDMMSAALAAGEPSLTIRQLFEEQLETGRIGSTALREQFPEAGLPKATDSPADWAAWRQQNSSFLQ
jgi:hypothetical protein